MIEIFRSPSAFKKIRKRIPVWIITSVAITVTLYRRPDLIGVLTAYVELVLAILIDEFIKEGYWFNVEEAAPQTHEATITTIVIVMLIVIAAIIHNPVIVLLFAGIVILALLG